MSLDPVSNIFLIGNNELFFQCAESLEITDFGRCAQVCKLWDELFQHPGIWKSLSQREGIPLVEGEDRNRKHDFRILYPITISGKIISQFIGKPIGEIPRIRLAIFNRLQQRDPFDPQRSMRENYVFVVVPSQVARPVTPLTLDASGTLVKLTDSAVEERVLQIPFSLKNLKMLCEYPLRGGEHMPVFDKSSYQPVFDQCGPCLDSVRIYFMRKRVADQTRSLPYPQQEGKAREQGLEVTPILPRALYDAVCILRSGTCPDNREPPTSTYARTSDLARVGNSTYHSVLGGFAPRAGADVSISDDDYVDIGVAPGVSAEVLPQPLALGKLAIGKGH